MSLLAYYAFHLRRSCTKTTAARYSTQAKTVRDGKTYTPNSLEAAVDSFKAAGIRPPVVASLRTAFPNVREPTAMQRKLIRAMTKNQDVLLQDDTGTGKSFAVMLALLSKFSTRKASFAVNENDDSDGKAPRGLLIVPHRDLAYQYLHWIHHMTLPDGDTASSLAKYAQVLVRNANKSTMQGLPVRMREAIRSSSSDRDLVIAKPPRILIATPNAALEFVEHQTEWFRPSTVVVDEVDALLRVPSSRHPKEGKRASQKKPEKHVPDLVRILDRIYPSSQSKCLMGRGSRSDKDESREPAYAVPTHKPQLVMISATLRSRLQGALFDTFGWVRRGEVIKLIRKRSSALPSHRLGRSAIHHVLVVSKTGDIRNIDGALPSGVEVGGNATVEKDDENVEDGIVYDGEDDQELVDEADKELFQAPLAFDPTVLEAVAAVCALDVPQIALFVLPATAAVRKVIFELRQLGVNAQPLDLVENEASRTHVLSRGNEEVSDENPVLIVGTLATVRGIDLPNLSHVFMHGVPEGQSGDAYLHVAGRVGRFGRQGKVVTVLEEGRTGNEVRQMRLLLSRIGLQARRLELSGVVMKHCGGQGNEMK